LTLGVVHPMRFRQERLPIVERIHRGEERVSHVQGRFFIHRLSNVGATGLQRSWTDNLLWHHTTHLIDFGLWMVCGGDMATADARIRNIYSAYPPIEPRTGIPMELVLVVETHDDQTIVCTGSYYSGRVHLRHPRRHRPRQLPGQTNASHGTTPTAIVAASVLLWAVHFMILRGIKEAAAINTIATVAQDRADRAFHHRRNCRVQGRRLRAEFLGWRGADLRQRGEPSAQIRCWSRCSCSSASRAPASTHAMPGTAKMWASRRCLASSASSACSSLSRCCRMA